MTKLFGTNGIRGKVNKDMTCELALGIGMAWGTYLKKTFKKPNVAIGTDARLSNDMLKNAITAGFLSVGCNVVDAGLLPTPALQYTVKNKDFNSGVMITASHNPPQYNGIKGFDNDGTEYLKDTEEKIENLYFSKEFNHADWNKVGKLSKWEDGIKLYIDGILSNVDVDLINKKNFHVVLDCGNGAGSVAAPILLEKLGCKVTKLYCEPDGFFPGHNSEPLPENLGDLMKRVSRVKADIGVAQDGDADRAIFVDENGKYIWGDKTLALAGKYITKNRKNSVVVTPITTSTCFSDVIEENNGKVIQTSVGSPIVAKVMKENNAVFGGEENGGLIFPEMQYCRDSSMTIAKILEIMAMEDKSLSELIHEIPSYEVCKIKTPCPDDKKDTVTDILRYRSQKINDIERVDFTDGIKLYFSNGWVMMRPSGTEQIYRIYSESKDLLNARDLAKKFHKQVEEIINKK